MRRSKHASYEFLLMSSAQALWGLVVWHLSSQLINSFNKAESAVFQVQSMLPDEFQFFSLIARFLGILANQSLTSTESTNV